MIPKIHIPSPCSEDWSKMKIGHQSRFCGSCSKSVIDFTQMTREEILSYLLQNRNTKVCGHISRSQLNFSTSDYLITINNLSKTTKNTNLAFYLLAFGAMTLAGCNSPSTAQTPPTDSVSIVNMANDSLLPPPTKCPPKNTTIKEETTELMGKIAPVDYYLEGEISVFEDTLQPLRFSDTMPEYIGGMDSLQLFIKNNLKYSHPKKEGVVVIEFTVLSDGSLVDFLILKSLGDTYDKEVLRLMKTMQKWKPGEQNSKAVDVKFTLPIEFKN